MDRAVEPDGSCNEVWSNAEGGPSLPSSPYSDFVFSGHCIIYPRARQFLRTVIKQRLRLFAVSDQKSEFSEVAQGLKVLAV